MTSTQPGPAELDGDTQLDSKTDIETSERRSPFDGPAGHLAGSGSAGSDRKRWRSRVDLPSNGIKIAERLISCEMKS
jgi:hypothetical protein